ncbi:vomeronasal type-2 receptor 116-like isoform X3 [Peromyscus californicus insignis]|uniref:vomeronasal type-2 receptor 116-like isoform X3 n=1 Tax=Peromyscus californicus insignis TaxID=564181 RepID=UPI0022A6A3ED|nr:vomeronasal type-2 receptor 116-like isoform X3 [Peromyscus californicus insignis]
MFTLIFLFLLLNIPLLVSSIIHPKCFWRMKQNNDKDGHLLTGCIFFLLRVQWPVEKDYFNHILNTLTPTENKFPLALTYSVDEVNRNPDLLPNMSLVFQWPKGGCKNVSKLNSFMPLSEENQYASPNYDCNEEITCIMMLTGPNWKTSVMIGTLLDPYRSQQILQLTYGPFHTILSDREKFPYLYQMAPKDTALPLAMVSLMLHFNWNWIGLAISDNDQGTQFLSHLRTEMERNAVCFAFVSIIPVNMHLYMSRAEMYYNQIITSSANVVIIYGDTDSTLALSFRMWESLGIQRIWVTTSQWDVTTSKRDSPVGTSHGTLAFSHHHSEISGFKTFVQTLNPLKYTDEYLARLGWMNFNCAVSASKCETLKNCSFNASLQWLMGQTFDMTFSDDSYDIYNAVYTAAHAVHVMLLQHVDNENEHHHNCLKLHSFLRKTHFTNPVGEKVNMNQRENLQAEYYIFQIWNFPNGIGFKVKIGEFSPYFPNGHQLHLYDDVIEWSTGSRQMPPSVCSADCSPGFRKFLQEGIAACCFDCIPCPENEVSNETSVVLGVFVKHHDTPIVKANNQNLSYILLISLMFCFLCSLLFIGQPNSATCVLQQITFGVVFTVAISTVLAKTVTVLLAFIVIAPGRRIRFFMISRAPKYIIAICTLIQIILCAIWLLVSPPFIDIDAHSEHGQIIIVCNKGSVTAFYCVLGYHGSLALGSFFVAFLARNLPDKFNEAKLLTFSMLLFCSVWVTFLPVYHSTKGKVMVVVEVFSILSSSAGLLGCIFIPKCYIILLRPERNSLQKLREKTSY